MMVETGELAAELAALKRRSPQRYGYLTRYWEDAKLGLDGTEKNYARVTDVHANVPDPRTGTRGLGQTLVLLAELDVLSILTDRSNATIYDLTTYDPERLAAVGRLLSAQ